MINRKQLAAPDLIPEPLPPHNQEAEEALLGSILIDEDVLYQIADLELSGADFYIHRFGWIFEAALALHRSGQRVDLLTLTDKLERQGRLAEAGGLAYLTGLMNITPTALHGAHYARIVKRDAILRQLIEAAGQIARLAHDPANEDVQSVLDQAESLLQEVAHRLPNGHQATVSEMMPLVSAQLEQALHNGGVVGLRTGFTYLDRHLGGLKPGKLYVLAGQPGMGKSALALQMVWQAVRDEEARALVFALEMSREALTRRLWALEAKVPSYRIEQGRVTPKQLRRLQAALSRLAQAERLKIIEAAHLTIDEIRQEALNQQARTGLDLIMIDYLQLLVTEKRREDRQAEIAALSRMLKTLAGELNVPILALSQLNRSGQGRSNQRPRLADLGESAALEQDSDVLMVLYRDVMYNPTTQFPHLAELHIAKHRDGKTGQYDLFFQEAIHRFTTIAKMEQRP